MRCSSGRERDTEVTAPGYGEGRGGPGRPAPPAGAQWPVAVPAAAPQPAQGLCKAHNGSSVSHRSMDNAARKPRVRCGADCGLPFALCGFDYNRRSDGARDDPFDRDDPLGFTVEICLPLAGGACRGSRLCRSTSTPPPGFSLHAPVSRST
eukprot:3178693-Prymnesium_polylepis.1